MIRNFSKIRSLRQFTADSQEVQIVTQIVQPDVGESGLPSNFFPNPIQSDFASSEINVVPSQRFNFGPTGRQSGSILGLRRFHRAKMSVHLHRLRYWAVA